MKDRIQEKGKDKERLYIPKRHNRWGEPRPKPGARNNMRVSLMKGRAQVFEASYSGFSGIGRKLDQQ